MNFTLTVQVIDKIAFAMEDQKERYAVDVDTGELVPIGTRGSELPEEKYARLPRWGSAEGFHLMESFVTSIDNPAYREQLTRALTMGKGVFRAFKDALKASKEIEKLWFDYKERRLRGVIVSWYNANREARGLAKLPVEPEDTEELLMSDFSFAWEPKEHGPEILQLDRDAFFELFPREEPDRLEKRYTEKRAGIPDLGNKESPILIAETPGRGARGLRAGAHRGAHGARHPDRHHAGAAGNRARRGDTAQVPHRHALPRHAAVDNRDCGQVAEVLGFLPVHGVSPRDAGPGVQPGRAAVLIAPGERRSRHAIRTVLRTDRASPA